MFRLRKGFSAKVLSFSRPNVLFDAAGDGGGGGSGGEGGGGSGDGGGEGGDKGKSQVENLNIALTQAREEARQLKEWKAAKEAEEKTKADKAAEEKAKAE